MLEIDKLSRTPIYEQVVNKLERAIIMGEFEFGVALPSVRQLSQELSINPNTLQKAYTELERKGVCFSVPGSGRFVAKEARDSLINEKKNGLKEMRRICAELKACGISYDEIAEVIKKVFEEEDK